jgi:hypothetical protein
LATSSGSLDSTFLILWELAPGDHRVVEDRTDRRGERLRAVEHREYRPGDIEAALA